MRRRWRMQRACFEEAARLAAPKGPGIVLPRRCSRSKRPHVSGGHGRGLCAKELSHKVFAIPNGTPEDIRQGEKKMGRSPAPHGCAVAVCTNVNRNCTKLHRNHGKRLYFTACDSKKANVTANVTSMLQRYKTPCNPRPPLLRCNRGKFLRIRASGSDTGKASHGMCAGAGEAGVSRKFKCRSIR